MKAMAKRKWRAVETGAPDETKRNRISKPEQLHSAIDLRAKTDATDEASIWKIVPGLIDQAHVAPGVIRNSLRSFGINE